MSRRRLSEAETRRFVRQIIKALSYCHNKGIVHRDLKLENLLLADTDTLKVTDFGFSNMFLEGGLMSTFVGSPAYAAPEILANERYCGPKVDVWSLGVILFTLLTGEMPFQDENIAVILKQINNADYTLPENISSDAADLIHGLLRRNPEERLSMAQVEAHPWILKGEAESPVVDILQEKRDLHDACLASLKGARYAEKRQAQFDLLYPIINLLSLFPPLPPKDLGVDTQQLDRELKAGEMTRNTATYYIRLDQLHEEEQKRKAERDIETFIRSLPAAQPGSRRGSPFLFLNVAPPSAAANTDDEHEDDALREPPKGADEEDGLSAPPSAGSSGPMPFSSAPSVRVVSPQLDAQQQAASPASSHSGSGTQLQQPSSGRQVGRSSPLTVNMHGVSPQASPSITRRWKTRVHGSDAVQQPQPQPLHRGASTSSAFSSTDDGEDGASVSVRPQRASVTSAVSSTHGSIQRLLRAQHRLSLASSPSSENVLEEQLIRPTPQSMALRQMSRASLTRMSPRPSVSGIEPGSPGRSRRISTFGATVTQCEVEADDTSSGAPSVFSPQGSTDNLLNTRPATAEETLKRRDSSNRPAVSPLPRMVADLRQEAALDNCAAPPSSPCADAADGVSAQGVALPTTGRQRAGSFDVGMFRPRRGSHKVTMLLDEARTTMEPVNSRRSSQDSAMDSEPSRSRRNSPDSPGRAGSASPARPRRTSSASARAVAILSARARTHMRPSDATGPPPGAASAGAAAAQPAAAARQNDALSQDGGFRSRSQSNTAYNRPRGKLTSAAVGSPVLSRLRRGKAAASEESRKHVASVLAEVRLQEQTSQELLDSRERLDVGALDLANEDKEETASGLRCVRRGRFWVWSLGLAGEWVGGGRTG